MEADSRVKIKFIDKTGFLNLFAGLLKHDVHQVLSLFMSIIEDLSVEEAIHFSIVDLLL